MFLTLIERLKDPKLNKKLKLCRFIDYVWYIFLSWVENLYIKSIPCSRCSLNTQLRDRKIIASLTSYPGRIKTVHLAIKSIMLQSVKPDLVELWLSEEQFPQKQLPERLNELVGRGLCIRYTKVDYRSHKKYFVALQEQKEDELVITFDDDIIYDPKCIERAIKKHIQYPNSIVVNQAKEITNNIDNTIKKYREWRIPKKGSSPSFKFFPLTGSGCLYPYGVMKAVAFDWDYIKKYALTTDDIWIKFVSSLSGVPIVETEPRAKTFSTISSSQVSHLGQVNCLEDGNDTNFQKLLDVFPSVLGIISNN